jgi:hypothetical protein
MITQATTQAKITDYNSRSWLTVDDKTEENTKDNQDDKAMTTTQIITQFDNPNDNSDEETPITTRRQHKTTSPYDNERWQPRWQRQMKFQMTTQTTIPLSSKLWKPDDSL